MTEADLDRIRAGTSHVCHGQWPRFDEMLERFGDMVVYDGPLLQSLEMVYPEKPVMGIFSNGTVIPVCSNYDYYREDDMVYQYYDNEHHRVTNAVVMDLIQSEVPTEVLRPIKQVYWELLNCSIIIESNDMYIRTLERLSTQDRNLWIHNASERHRSRSLLCLDLKRCDGNYIDGSSELSFMRYEMERCDCLLPILAAIIMPDGRCYRYDSAGVFGLHCVFGENSPKNAAKRK